MSSPKAIKSAETPIVSHPKTQAIRSCLSSRVTKIVLALLGLVGLALAVSGVIKFLPAYSVYAGISLFAFSVIGLFVSILAAPVEQKSSKVITPKRPVKRPTPKEESPPPAKPIKKEKARKKPEPSREEKTEPHNSIPKAKRGKKKEKRPLKSKEPPPPSQSDIPKEPELDPLSPEQAKTRQETRAAIDHFGSLIQQATTYQELEAPLSAMKKSVAAYKALPNSAPFDALEKFENHQAVLENVLEAWKGQALLQKIDDSFPQTMLKTRQIVNECPNSFSSHYPSLYLLLVQQAFSMRLYQCCQNLRAVASSKQLSSEINETAEAYLNWKNTLGQEEPVVTLPPGLEGTFSSDLHHYLAIVEYRQHQDRTKLDPIPEAFLEQNLALANFLIDPPPQDDSFAKKVLILLLRQAETTFLTVKDQQELASAIEARKAILALWNSITTEEFTFDEEQKHYPTLLDVFEELGTLSSAEKLSYDQNIDLHKTSEKLNSIPDTFYAEHFSLTQLLLNTLESINSKPREAPQPTSQQTTSAIDLGQIRREREAKRSANQSSQTQTNSTIERLKKIQKPAEIAQSEPVEAAPLALAPPEQLEPPQFELDIRTEIGRAHSSSLLKEVIEEIDCVIGEPGDGEEQALQTFRANKEALLKIAKSWETLEKLAKKPFFIDRDIEKIIALLEELPEKESELYTLYPSLRQQLNLLMMKSIKQVGVLESAQKKNVQTQSLAKANTLAKSKVLALNIDIFDYVENVIKKSVDGQFLLLQQSKDFESDYRERKERLQEKINKIQGYLQDHHRYTFKAPTIEFPLGEANLLLKESLTAPQATWGELFKKINSLIPSNNDPIWEQFANVKTQLSEYLSRFHLREDLQNLRFGGSGAGRNHEEFKQNVLSLADNLGVEFTIEETMNTDNDEFDAAALQIQLAVTEAREAYTNALNTFSDRPDDERNAMAQLAATAIIDQLPEGYRDAATEQWLSELN